jgi:hypothetical protein
MTRNLLALVCLTSLLLPSVSQGSEATRLAARSSSTQQETNGPAQIAAIRAQITAMKRGAKIVVRLEGQKKKLVGRLGEVSTVDFVLIEKGKAPLELQKILFVDVQEVRPYKFWTTRTIIVFSLIGVCAAFMIALEVSDFQI